PAQPNKTGGQFPGRPPVCAPLGKNQVIELATLLRTLLILPPTRFMAVMAATEIREAIRTYSMAVAPSSFFLRRRETERIWNLQVQINVVNANSFGSLS